MKNWYSYKFVIATVFILLVASVCFLSCSNLYPKKEVQCLPIAYPEDKHKVCNSFDYYGDTTWKLDSVFCNGKDITDSMLKAVGGYYQIDYSHRMTGQYNDASFAWVTIKLGNGVCLPSKQFVSLKHDDIMFFSDILAPQWFIDSVKLHATLPLPLPFFHRQLGTTICEVDSVLYGWEYQSLSTSRMKVKHAHNDSVFIAIFKVL
jgi:hypothetical protein